MDSDSTAGASNVFVTRPKTIAKPVAIADTGGVITKDLMDAIVSEFRLKPDGLHGPAHWARVLVNGRILAERTGADRDVVELFAVFHDSKRRNEHSDPDHGRRGAEFAETLRGLLFRLDDEAFNLLYDACVYHTEGGTTGHVTIQTCWDADRLDLGRVGKRPKAELLCTDAARDAEVLDPAHAAATERRIPEFVAEDWGLDIAVKKKSAWF